MSFLFTSNDSALEGNARTAVVNKPPPNTDSVDDLVDLNNKQRFSETVGGFTKSQFH